MRLFFALWPDADVQRELARWGRICHGVCGGRKAPMERLHVTVAFLGEVEPERYPAIVEIGASIGAGRFELLLDRVGYWPRQRIVYAAARELPAPLADLSRALAERVSAACLPTDKRVFVPHVTLLRDAKRAPEGIVFPGMHWEVRALTLVETIRTGRKLAYQQRECWTL